MSKLSTSVIVISTQEENKSENHISILKRPRSPSIDIPHKISASQEMNKRHFYQILAPGMVKIIWVIKDLEDIINFSPDIHTDT